MKRFEQVVLQVESYSMDGILQIFKWSICSSTPFFESLAKKSLVTMDDLFRWANKYSMLEDNVWAATQQVLVTNRSTKQGAPSPQTNRGKLARDRMASSSRVKWVWPHSISYMRNPSQWSTICPNSGGQSRSRQIWLNGIGAGGAPIIKITTIPLNNLGISITWWKD